MAYAADAPRTPFLDRSKRGFDPKGNHSMIHKSNGIRLAMVGAAAAASLAMFATPAQAAETTSVSKSGNTLLVTGTSGDNSIIVRPVQGGFIEVVDQVDVSAGSGCVRLEPGLARCSTSGISQVRVSAGLGRDRVSNVDGLLHGRARRQRERCSSQRRYGSGSVERERRSRPDLFGGTVDSLFGQNGDDELFDGLFLRGGSGTTPFAAAMATTRCSATTASTSSTAVPGSTTCAPAAEITSNCEAF